MICEWLSYDDTGAESRINIEERYGLVLLDKTISAPEPKLIKIDVPFADGLIDVTSQYGRIKYNNREITMTFEIIGSDTERMTAYNNLMSLVHMSFRRLVFSDDPLYYWRGICKVSELKRRGTSATVTIVMDAFTYKGTISGNTYEFPAHTETTKSISITKGIGWPEIITPDVTTRLTITDYTFSVNETNKNEMIDVFETTFSIKAFNYTGKTMIIKLCKGAL